MDFGVVGGIPVLRVGDVYAGFRHIQLLGVFSEQGDTIGIVSGVRVSKVEAEDVDEDGALILVRVVEHILSSQENSAGAEVVPRVRVGSSV